MKSQLDSNSSLEEIRNYLPTAVVSKKELNNGWLFQFDHTITSTHIQRFANHEQECCSFLEFNISDDDENTECIVTLKADESLDIDTVKEIIYTLFS